MSHLQPDLTQILTPFVVSRTTSREAFEAAVRGPYNASQFDFPDRKVPFEAVNSRVTIRGTTLHHAHYKAPLRMKLAGRSSIRQPVVLNGRSLVTAGRNVFENSTAGTLIFPSDAECFVECGHGYAQILMDFDVNSMYKHGLDISGYAPIPMRRIKKSISDDPSKLARLGSIATALVFNLDSIEALYSPVVIELEQALMTAFMIENGFVLNLTSNPLPSLSTARTLREYIDANWSRPLTVEDVARECNVSVRSVFLQFNKIVGLSPMLYLRNVRLDESRRMLQDTSHEPSVMRIAFMCGFSHVGHFARRYRERFGELPSETVRKTAHARGQGNLL